MKIKKQQIMNWPAYISIALLALACTKAPDDDLIDDVEELPILDESIPAVIPHIYINIDGNAEVIEKDTYLYAEIQIEGNGKYNDIGTESIVRTRIKGRGNSTWGRPKKPYRLKLDEAAKVLGLPEAKDWVLLANYYDYTFMTNAVAMKIAKQLGMPYTNDIIPVDLTINGEYRGNYNLTQQIEVKKNRVDVGDDGILWELDKYFDEDPWQFKSNHLNLPVMLKDPDMESQAQFDQHIKEFQNFEDLLFAGNFPNNNYGNVFDKQQFVNFLIVNNLTRNAEINHPGSTMMHKKAGGKFTMGPIWDFDYGFGLDERTYLYFNYVELPLTTENDDRPGSELYKRLLRDPELRKLYNDTWKHYRNTKFDELMNFIEHYAATIRESQKKDFEVWGFGNRRGDWKAGEQDDLGKSKADLKTWLRKRVKYIDGEMSKL